MALIGNIPQAKAREVKKFRAFAGRVEINLLV
jgi:hypothetical protein